MERPIDRQLQEEILRRIKKMSRSYTPKWRMDINRPDIGTGLAMLYANMYGGTKVRYEQLLDKHRIEFFNRIGANLQPAIPAKGYVAFTLTQSDVPSTSVPQGMKLRSEDESGEEIVFQTSKDVEVIPSELAEIILVDPLKDAIYKYDKEHLEEIALFEGRGKNWQRHDCYLSHDTVFNTDHMIWLNVSLSQGYIRNFYEKGNLKMYYSTEEGFVEFASIFFSDEKCILTLNQERPWESMEVDQEYRRWLKVSVEGMEADEAIDFEQVTCFAECSWKSPRFIQAAEEEQEEDHFYPFSEQPSLYDTFLIGSNSVFSKKDAWVECQFDMEFAEIPRDVSYVGQKTNWKWVMDSQDMPKETTLDIRIEDIAWEYYNGQGWRRLKIENVQSDMFSGRTTMKKMQWKIRFKCPKDIIPLETVVDQTYAIRARILKMSNIFALDANFITPYVSYLHCRYTYEDAPQEIEHWITENNLLIKHMDYMPKRPFEALKEKRLSLYMGFDRKLEGGPIKLLFGMKHALQKKLPIIDKQYLTYRGWKSLEVLDETENFRKTGQWTFMGPEDAAPIDLYGTKAYWIACRDRSNAYERDSQTLPFLEKIVMNTTTIIEVEPMDDEYFMIERQEINKRCLLDKHPIYSIEVWVNETYGVSLKSFEKDNRNLETQIVRDEYGNIKQIWVLWTCVEDFNESSSTSRHYCLDRRLGEVYFGDGRRGAIPPSQDTETIWIRYSVGGGSRGNLKEGQSFRLDRTLGFIDQIINPYPLSGGYEQEWLPQALKRLSAGMKNGGKGVTRDDLRDLVLESGRDIIKAKVFKGYKEDGSRDLGYTTIVILHEDYEEGNVFFERVKKRVMDYLKPRLSPFIFDRNRLHICQPTFIWLYISMRVEVASYDDAMTTRTLLRERLLEFLDPLKGNIDHQGWEVGKLPTREQIYNAISREGNYEQVLDMEMHGYKKNNGIMLEIDLSEEDRIFQLPIGIGPKISVEVMTK